MNTKDNDREQFRRMFMSHYARLVRLAVQLTGDRDEARDIVADVMERAWRRSDSLKAEEQGAWLGLCVRNACLNRLKHLKVESSHTEQLAEAVRTLGEADWSEHERLLGKVEAVASTLEEPTRSIIRMCYYEHNTHRQAAERLGISHETVKKHIRKALNILRERIKQKED